MEAKFFAKGVVAFVAWLLCHCGNAMSIGCTVGTVLCNLMANRYMCVLVSESRIMRTAIVH